MTSFLTFNVTAPLASFGGIAVGEQRASADRPAKSAILGLVAGALGIERDADDMHRALAQDLFYAVRSENMNVRTPRRLMSDYHTAQTRARSRNQRFATRKEELADKQSLETILSYREYRSDCAFTIALWLRSEASRFKLEDLKEALCKPVFMPYVGRKACPLMLPMQPLIFDAENVFDAFKLRDAARDKKQAAFLERNNLAAQPQAVALDADANPTLLGRRERRRDAILNRARWQFGLRDELVRAWEGGAA